MDQGLATVIGMSIAYVASFIGMGLAWWSWRRRAEEGAGEAGGRGGPPLGDGGGTGGGDGGPDATGGPGAAGQSRGPDEPDPRQEEVP